MSYTINLQMNVSAHLCRKPSANEDSDERGKNTGGLWSKGVLFVLLSNADGLQCKLALKMINVIECIIYLQKEEKHKETVSKQALEKTKIKKHEREEKV